MALNENEVDQEPKMLFLPSDSVYKTVKPPEEVAVRVHVVIVVGVAIVALAAPAPASEPGQPLDCNRRRAIREGHS